MAIITRAGSVATARRTATALSLCMFFAATAGAQPTLTDPNLSVATVVTGLSQPTSMAFIGPNDFFILEKASGRVKRVVNGAVMATVLDLPVNSNSERGLLGIALDPNFPATPNVYLYWTESSTGADSTVVTEVGNPASAFPPGTPQPLGNRVDRFTWNATTQTLTYAGNLIRLHAFQNDQNNALNPALFTPQGNHNGGKLAMGPDGKLNIIIGDNGRRGWMQNLPNGPFLPPTGFDDQFGGPAPDDNHLTGVILRLNLNGSAPADNPFFAAGAAIGGQVGANIQKLYSYGHRNSFGLAFDPFSGSLWDSENGDDAFDEINKIARGGDHGWVQVMGPLSRVAQFKAIETNLFTPANAPIGAIQQLRYPVTRIADDPAVALAGMLVLPGATYQDPELSWRYAIPPAGLGFVRGNGLGASYNGTLWSGEARTTSVTGGATGTFAGGVLMVMRLTADRQHLDLSADPRLADRVADNGIGYPPPFGTPAGTAGYKFDGRESETLLIGQNFGIVTDIQAGPDGSLYVTSNTDNAVYRIFRAPTPPVVVPHISGTLGTNGWYTSDVTVTWSVTDPAFGIASSSGCGATTLTSDTGGTTLTCTATNGIGLSTTVSVTVKIDKTPPVFSGMPGASCSLWPPNNKMVEVATVAASDALSGVVPGSFTLTGTSNEPTGPRGPDIAIAPNDTGGFVVQLRADRNGNGTGRVYVLSATANDLAGNIATATATCLVPHDQGQ